MGSPSTWLLIDAKGCGCSAENTREGGDGRERMGENGQGKIGGATSNSICRLLDFIAQTGYVFIQGEDCKQILHTNSLNTYGYSIFYAFFSYNIYFL